MKKTVFLPLLAAFVLALTACGVASAPVESTAETAPDVVETTAMPETTEPEVTVFSYDDLKFTDFHFSSGAGAWGTVLHIEADGTFSGVYRDSEIGDQGEGYPLGTVYSSVFYGQLGEPVRVNDYTFRLPLQVLRYEQVPNSQKIEDQQRFCYTTALGVEGTPELLLYVPNAPMAELPEAYRQWVDPQNQQTLLPCWGLYNEAQQSSFTSTNRIQRIREQIQIAEELETSLTSQLTGEATQAEMNINAQQRFLVWDDALNALWSVLQDTLEDTTLTLLTKQQVSWIKAKEAAIAEAAVEFEGGSLAPLVCNDLAATMTKERVYFLLDYLPAVPVDNGEPSVGR